MTCGVGGCGIPGLGAGDTVDDAAGLAAAMAAEREAATKCATERNRSVRVKGLDTTVSIPDCRCC